MEYRKNARTPLDRTDEIFLQHMLEENAAEERYGEICSLRHTRQNNQNQPNCGCENNTLCGRNNRQSDTCSLKQCGLKRVIPGCGCLGNNNRAENRRSDNANNSGCGCERNDNGIGRQSGNGHHHNDSGCGCGNGRTNAVKEGYPLAMVYSPVQEWHELMEPEEALVTGTLFRDLVFPWYPAACREKNNCGCQGEER